ncbi:hypothetical protein J5N97_001939 [Dioscorea zingiberensis]|uniref:Uncharacterized protein n=1 Tax=Dioscorea zingiberensis TaxID=325984 RepID=A0A9D5H1X5_9LILI|nr:hypothetical protein J5N97_001939 [Dioscorea zingiberensis]
MATGWVKSLQCISNALDDVSAPSPTPRGPSPIKKKTLLLPINCGNPSHTLKDVVLLFPKQPPPPSKKPSSRIAHHPKPRPKPNPNPNPNPNPKLNPAPPAPIPPTKSLPTLTDLPAGHSSRRVVEIIFASSWSSRGAPFPGEIEMLFRVHNPPRTVARFEDYRTAVRAAAEGASDARCAADGNEMMRFQCAPHSSSASSATVDDAIYDARVVACAGGGIRTFAGSGGAHESVGGGGGRRSMLVCRVIAGRIRSGPREPSRRFESVSAGRGELLVFDPRAVLPCFLIIYRL